MSQSRIDPRFIQFQNDLKKTEFGLRFARALFTSGNKSLSQKFIREAFKQLGLEIPREVEITLDAAQAITSGAAVVEAYNAYNGFDDARSIIRPGLDTLAATTRVLEAFGWLKKDSDEAQILRTVGNVAAIIASWGTNWKAWLALALDFTAFEAKNEMNAKRIANEALGSYIKARLSPQAQAAAANVAAFQAGGMSAFAFVGKMAEVAPDLWPQFFPQFNTWAPVHGETIAFRGESRTWYGSTSSHTATYGFESFGRWSPNQIKEFIFRYLAEPVLFPFFIANEEYQNAGKASLKTLGALGALGYLRTVSTGDNSRVLLDNEVTLSDFFDPIVLQKIETFQEPSKIKSKSAITMDGFSQLLGSATGAAEREKQFDWDNRQILAGAEYAGRIDVVWQSAVLRKTIRDAMTFPAIAPDPRWGEWNELRESDNAVIRRGETEARKVMRFGGPGAAWRDPKNYFAALAMIYELRKDEYMASWSAREHSGQAFRYGTGPVFRFAGRDLSTYDFLPDVEELDASIRELQWKLMIRKTNTLALSNIAFFLSTTPEKLMRMNRDADESAIYDARP